MNAVIVSVVVLGLIAWGTLWSLGAERPWLQVAALARATLQLAVLSLVLRWALIDLRLTLALLAVMTAVAIYTANGRTPVELRHPLTTTIALTAGWMVPVGIILLSGAVSLDDTQKLLALGGILIGNAMNATSLLTRSLATSFAACSSEMLAWLSLGATPRRAARDAVRHAVSTAVMPATDQARTTGLVTLPGAFVGSLFAGASPVDAGAFQLLVLAGILSAGAIVALVMTRRCGAPAQVPADTRL